MVSYIVGESSLLFVEASAFKERVQELLDEETYLAFQNELVRNPEKGTVMKGCGGLRKARTMEPWRGKGRRVGCRVIYLYIPEANRIDLLAVYGKDVQDDLTMEQRKGMKALAERARREALAQRRRQKDK